MSTAPTAAAAATTQHQLPTATTTTTTPPAALFSPTIATQITHLKSLITTKTKSFNELLLWYWGTRSYAQQFPLHGETHTDDELWILNKIALAEERIPLYHQELRELDNAWKDLQLAEEERIEAVMASLVGNGTMDN